MESSKKEVASATAASVVRSALSKDDTENSPEVFTTTSLKVVLSKLGTASSPVVVTSIWVSRDSGLVNGLA